MPLTLKDYAPFISPAPRGGAAELLGSAIAGFTEDIYKQRSALEQKRQAQAMLAEEVRQADLMDEAKRRQRELESDKFEQETKFKQSAAIRAASELFQDPAMRPFGEAALGEVGVGIGEQPAAPPPEMQPPGMTGLPPVPGLAAAPGVEQPLPAPGAPGPGVMAAPGVGMPLPDVGEPLMPGERPTEEPLDYKFTLAETEEPIRSIDDFSPAREEGEIPLEPARDPALSDVVPEVKEDGGLYLYDRETGEQLTQFKFDFKEKWVQDFAAAYSRSLAAGDIEQAARLRAEAGTNKSAQKAVDTVHWAIEEQNKMNRVKAMTPGQRQMDKDNTPTEGFKAAERLNDKYLAPLKDVIDNGDMLLAKIKSGKGLETFEAVKQRIRQYDNRLSDFDIRTGLGYQSLWDRFKHAVGGAMEGKIGPEQREQLRVATERQLLFNEKQLHKIAGSMVRQSETFDSQGLDLKARGFRDQVQDIYFPREKYPWIVKFIKTPRYRRAPPMKGPPRARPMPAGDKQAVSDSIEEMLRRSEAGENVGGLGVTENTPRRRRR